MEVVALLGETLKEEKATAEEKVAEDSQVGESAACASGVAFRGIPANPYNYTSVTSQCDGKSEAKMIAAMLCTAAWIV
ncbi:hypothetical protein SB861_48715 [Paraburkholderia sp. SIMBA_049]